MADSAASNSQSQSSTRPGPDSKSLSPAEEVRFLLRCASQVTLGTLGSLESGEEGTLAEPYASLALMAVDHQGAPLLLLSDMAEHTRNLANSDRVSLLVQGSGGFNDPLEGSRASVQGSIEVCDGDEKAPLLARFISRFPSAELYAGFKDFQLYRVRPTRAHLVAGFGRIHWVTAETFLFTAEDCAALAEAEAGIVHHMNDDHLDALEVIARAFPGSCDALSATLDPGKDAWQMVGIDPEGFDLRAGKRLSRLSFADPRFASLDLPPVIRNSSEARKALVALTLEARRLMAD
ncbi:HugZ family protein [Rhodovibrionaceae bacterium A322]